jgi:multiple sugar transport system substrate-binding protein
MKLTIWVGWSAWHELTTFKKVAAEYDAQHPDVTVSVVGGIDDNKIVAAIRSGTAPDVVSSFNSYNVGNYCGSGGWIDLAPYMKKDNINASMFPPAPRYYTQYAGKRCALPLLADDYGLCYSKSLFRRGHHHLRRRSRATADAGPTVRNKDGRSRSPGSTRSSGSRRERSERWITSFGGKWNDAQSHAILVRITLGEVGQVAKSLVVRYGYNNLIRFSTRGDSSPEASRRGTKLAMNLDGEWRIAFIQNEHQPQIRHRTDGGGRPHPSCTGRATSTARSSASAWRAPVDQAWA